MSINASQLIQQKLEDVFEYIDGELFYKKSPYKSHVKAGDVAGNVSKYGYKRIFVDGKEMMTHRAIFLMHHGYLPRVVDHINGNKLDNRIENLRSSCFQTNQYNRKKNNNNKSGCKNVSYSTKDKVWVIHINVNKKPYRWHTKDFELAELIAHEARSLYHGEFAKHD